MARNPEPQNVSAPGPEDGAPVEEMTPPMFGPPLGLRAPFLSPETAPPLPESGGPDDGRASSDPGKPSPGSIDLSKRKITLGICKDVFTGLLGAASGLMNARFALDEDDETWIMRDKELTTIAVPVARIVARRVPAIPEGSDTSTSDILDGVTAAVGLCGYGLRCMLARLERRRAMRRDVPRFYEGDGAELGDASDDEQGPAPAPAYIGVHPDHVRAFGAVPFVPRPGGPPL